MSTSTLKSKITIHPLGYTITVDLRLQSPALGLEHNLITELPDWRVNSDTEAADNRLEAIADLVAAHARAGVNIEAPAYITGVESELSRLIDPHPTDAQELES
jgi:hypothetical protein